MVLNTGDLIHEYPFGTININSLKLRSPSGVISLEQCSFQNLAVSPSSASLYLPVQKSYPLPPVRYDQCFSGLMKTIFLLKSYFFHN